MEIPRLITLTNKASYFLFGARGTGKSTTVKGILAGMSPKSILGIDLLDLQTEDLYAREPGRLEAEIKARLPALKWIFIDEIQKQPKLLDMVHRIIENEKVKFILTGSSARKLKRGGANLLAGRAHVYNLFPFSCFELEEKFDLQTVLHWGSLPAIYLCQDDQDRMQRLRAYTLTYIKEEVQQEQLVRNLDPFREFLEVAARSNGKIINYSAIAKEVGPIDHKTVQSYFQIPEDTFLGFFVPAYSRSVRKAQTQSPKFYLFDPGVKRALERTLDTKLKPKTYAYGDGFEHWVVCEFFRLNHTLARDFRMSYFRTKDGVEIDLILSKPKQTILCEIKSRHLVDIAKVRRFAKLSRDFESATAYWLSQDPVAQRVENVKCLHWKQGLAEIFFE